MSYQKNWHSFLLIFSVATWLSQPLYSYVVANDLFQETTAQSVLWFMFLYHGVPLAVLITLDRIIFLRWGPGIPLTIARGLMFAAAITFFLRAEDLDFDIPALDSLNRLPVAAIMVLLAVAFAALTATLIKFHQLATVFFVYMSIVSVGLTALFIAQVGLVGKPWTSDGAKSRSTSSLTSTIPLNSELPPVFLIVFDGMDADVLAENGQVDPSLFPHFAALARTSAFFTNATSNYFDTSVSIQSLVTGVYYGDDGFFQAQDSSIQDVGVLKILKDAGYSVVLHSNFSQLVKCGDERFFLCRAEATAVVNKGIHKVARDFAIDFVPRKISLSARDLILKIFPGSVTIIIPFPSIHQYDRPLWNQFLAGVGRSESPGKVYLVHLTLPHHPYELDRMGRRTRTIGPDGGFDDLKQMANNYREQVTFVDTLLGELIEKLKAEGLYNQSLLVVTADHGPRSLGLGQKYAGFREHSFSRMTWPISFPECL